MNTAIRLLIAAPLLGLSLTTTAPAFAGGPTVKESHGHLVDGKGMSLYLFEPDNRNMSTCNGACARAWPPLTGTAMAEGMAKSSLLGTVKRKDGSTQVTYNGWPLYYFVRDEDPGDMYGQGKDGFGGEWYLVEPNGMAKE